MLLRLLEQRSCLFPVARISFKLGLLDENNRVEQLTSTFSVLAVFLDQLIRLVEFLQASVHIDGLIKHVVPDIVRASLLQFALIREDFRSKPDFIQIPHVGHLLCKFTQVDELQVTNVHESLTSMVEIFAQ